MESSRSEFNGKRDLPEIIILKEIVVTPGKVSINPLNERDFPLNHWIGFAEFILSAVEGLEFTSKNWKHTK
jgi:hypothetical protein